MKNKPLSISARKFDADPYKLLLFHIFYGSYEDYENYKTAIDGGLFPEAAIDPKRFLEEYFGVELTIKDE